mgnify:CR=1 FL=1
MKKIVNIFIFGLLLLIFSSYMFTFQVRENEVAFLSSSGQTKPVKGGPGLKFRMPQPFQQLYKFDKRIRLVEGDYTEVSTAEQGTVNVQIYFGWKIDDTKADTFFKSFSGSDSEGYLREASKELLRIVNEQSTAVIKTDVPEIGHFITFGKTVAGAEGDQAGPYEEIEKNILTRAQAETKDLGVQIEFVGIQRVGVPQVVLDKVLDEMVTEWEGRANETLREVNAEAETTRKNAENERKKAIAQANRAATDEIQEAQDRAEKIFQEFKKDPKLAEFLIQLDALEKSVQPGSTLILDETMGPFPILRGRLPLIQGGELTPAPEE